MARGDEKKISCKRCQTRKIRCSRTSPCTKCISAGARCEYRDFDSKRTPISREYVTALESRVASLENFLSDIKATPSEQRDLMVDEIDFGGRVHRGDTPRHPQTVHPDKDISKIRNNRDASVSSSIFQTQLFRSSIHISPPNHLIEDASNIGHLAQDEDILECLRLFFRWHNPSLLFFDEVEFFTTLTSELPPSGLSSLIYSMASLGCLGSSTSKLREKAAFYQRLAEEKLRIENVSAGVSSVEACLLCSIYHAGDGNSIKAKLYADLASSLARELTQQTQLSGFNKEIPRGMLVDDPGRQQHMLLNLAKSDKLLALFVGRGVYTSIGQTAQIDSTSSPIKHKSFEIFEMIEEMSVLIASSLSPTSQFTATAITHLNAKFCAWLEGLPLELRWNRWGSSLDVIDPAIASLHMLYHAARIVLNRNFEEKTGLDPIVFTETDSYSIQSASVDLIVSILQRYKAQYNLTTSPLIFVQGAIVAADTSFTLAQQQNVSSHTDRENLATLHIALEEMSLSWGIARQAKVGLQNLLQSAAFIQEGECSPASGSDSDLSEPLQTPKDDCQSWWDLNLSDYDMSYLNAAQVNFQIPSSNNELMYELDSWGKEQMMGAQDLLWGSVSNQNL